jgi:Carboxypeptidase regulatory-like domain
MKRSSRYIGYSLAFICLALLAGTAVFPQSQTQTFTLTGLVVVNREGVVVLNADHTPERTLPDVEVRLTGAGIEQETVTDQNGEFRFEVPVGTYELAFRHPGYYEITMRGVEVKKHPSSTLKVTLPLSITSTQIILQRGDPKIIGPKRVPAPALELSYEPGRPLAAGHPMQGTLTIKNVGKESILIPTEPYTRGDQYSLQAKIIQINISPAGYNAHYDQKFICLPSKNCKSLTPNETISFPITIYDREGYYEQGRRVAHVYPKTGGYKLEARVYFKLPSDDPNKDIDVRTEAIERDFSVVVSNSK